MKKRTILLLLVVLLVGMVLGSNTISASTQLPSCGEATGSGDKSGPPPEKCTLIPGTCGQGPTGWKKVGRRTFSDGECEGGLIKYTSYYATELYRTGLYSCSGVDHPQQFFCEGEPFHTCCHEEVSCGYRPYDWGRSCDKVSNEDLLKVTVYITAGPNEWIELTSEDGTDVWWTGQADEEGGLILEIPIVPGLSHRFWNPGRQVEVLRDLTTTIGREPVDLRE